MGWGQDLIPGHEGLQLLPQQIGPAVRGHPMKVSNRGDAAIIICFQAPARGLMNEVFKVERGAGGACHEGVGR